MRKLRDAEFCALDIETTGINPVVDRIVEIGMIRFNIRDGAGESYCSLVHPGRDIPEKVIEIHGITNEMVRDAPPLIDILDDIAAFIGDRPLVIQNPRFDMGFLNIAYKLSGKQLPVLEAYDTVYLSRQTFMDMPNYRLTTLCSRLNIVIRHHRALSDAEAHMEVFRRVLKYHDPEGEWTFGDLQRLHGETIIPRLTQKQKEKLDFVNKIFIGDVVKIRYMDENGDITIRRIYPKEIIKNGRKSYIHAYCYLRKSDRYFNTRRILKIY